MPVSSPLYPSAPTEEPHEVDGADLAALTVLQERYLREVFRYVLRRVPRQEEAEDITAEVFASAFAALPQFRGQCPPYLWLLSIARRKIIDARRRRMARRETLASELAHEARVAAEIWQGLPAPGGPESELTQAEARRVLRELIAELNPDQQEALSLKYWEGLSIAEIATVMGRSPSAVTSLLHRARMALFRSGRGYFLGEDEETSHE
jgi:RNA polymerase sigma-70 factor (ECF subfamily)